MVLVGEPVDHAMPEIVLRDECRPSRSAKNQYVEPADVIADQQGVRIECIADDNGPGTHDARRHSKEALRPSRFAEEMLGRDMDRADDCEKQQKQKAADCGPEL
jgi:hypothetical protein